MQYTVTLFFLTISMYTLKASEIDSLFKYKYKDLSNNTSNESLTNRLHAADSMLKNANNPIDSFFNLYIYADLLRRNNQISLSYKYANILKDLVNRYPKKITPTYRVQANSLKAQILKSAELYSNALTILQQEIDYLSSIDPNSIERYYEVLYKILVFKNDLLIKTNENTVAIELLKKQQIELDTLISKQLIKGDIAIFYHFINQMNFTQVLINQNKYEEAIQYALNAIAILEQNPQNIHISKIHKLTLYLFLSHGYIGLKSYDKAYEYLNIGMEEAIALSEKNVLLFYYMLGNTYATNTNNTQAADSFKRLYTQLNDELKDSKSKTIDAIIANDKLKIAAYEKAFQRNKTYSYLIAPITLTILTISTLYFINKKRKKKKQILENSNVQQNARENHTQEIENKVLVSTKTNELTDHTTLPQIDSDKSEIDIETPKETNSISKRKEREIIHNLFEFENRKEYLNHYITIASMSSALGTNHKYLNHILKQERDKTFNDYINTMRIKYIVAQIKLDPKLHQYKISHLAEIAGFASHSRFTIIFKKEMNMSPSQYIQQCAKENM